MFGRIFATIALFVGSGIISKLVTPWTSLALGQAAGNQFAASNAAYISTMYTFGAINLFYVVGGIIFLLLLVLIWWKPLKDLMIKINGELGVLLFALALSLSFIPTNAKAYYDKQDWPEVYPILPNWSAFWIPNVGDNKTDQKQMDSAEYLNANKVPLKFFQVPHTKLPGSSYFSDYYIPAGRLILVDRTTFTHEWVDSTDRGDNAKKEGFPCQSKEGLDIAAGVSVGAKVEEADAAKFLYNFGVVTDEKSSRIEVQGGDSQHLSDPNVTFRALYYGRTLKSVMSDVGRKKIQTLVCNEIGSRTFDQANADYVKIMETISQKATEYFHNVGITISFIGWADTFTYDREIQVAVNRGYVAGIEEQNAKRLAPYAGTIQALAAADALRNFGQKSDGKFPTTVVGSVPDVNALFGSFLVAPKVLSIPTPATTSTGDKH